MLLFLGDFVYAGVALTDALSTSPFRYETLLQLSSARRQTSSARLLHKGKYDSSLLTVTNYFRAGDGSSRPRGVEQGATVLMMKNSTKFPLTINFPLLELRILNDTATHKL